MNTTYESHGRAMRLVLTVKCKDDKMFRVVAEEYKAMNSKYADRMMGVEKGERTIYLSFPTTPQTLFISIVNVNNPSDTDFECTITEEELVTYNIAMDYDTARFMKFIQRFSDNCGKAVVGANPSTFKTNDGMFTIKYFDVIREQSNGQPINTPARIGHKSGIIEVAKCKFDVYTIPMRIMILLHEFSHKYKNPKIGLKISHETGADINGLYIYLGLGYSKIDAITVFSKVFLKAQTPQNRERMRKINDYIQRFENGEFAKEN